MSELVRTKKLNFEDLFFFEREVTQPQIIKKELDKIMPKLRKIGVEHKNIVISKVVGKNPTKKTMMIQIRVPISVNDKLSDFLKDYPQYELEKKFTIDEGVKLTITNNEKEFREGIKLLMNQRPGLDLSNNSIIEVSQISYYGDVIGFELFLEDK
ncbi:hypothetical protein [Anaerococcus urinomassiliensis]|uniref:hypothetical protein n=1 Tax=Anaerococcus urinomassiliensis TaxID=1745712 RepID=UPI00093C533A|nr:hypothetical protein [Anaerococcus urinomassiliensis]